MEQTGWGKIKDYKATIFWLKQIQADVPELPNSAPVSCTAASPILPGCLHRFSFLQQHPPYTCTAYLASIQHTNTHRVPRDRLTGDHDTWTNLATRNTKLATMIKIMGPIATIMVPIFFRRSKSPWPKGEHRFT